MAVIADILVAAALYGCEPGELMSYRMRENGDISVIAPTGQKFVYAKVLVDQQREKMLAKAEPQVRPKVAPKPEPRARKRAPAKPAASKAKAKPVSKPSAISSADEKKH